VNYISVETVQNEDDEEHVLFGTQNRFKEYDYQDVEIVKKSVQEARFKQFGTDCADNPDADCNPILKGQNPCDP